MSIVENLGIKPIDRRNMWAGTFQKLMCDNEPVEKLEQLNNELLETLIEVRSCGTDERMSNEYLDKIIQKADPQHRTYEEIKELNK